MSLAGTAARGATVQLPLGQLALVGLGFFFVSNPDKLLQTLAASSKLLQAADNSGSGGGQHQPIIIHQAAPAAATSGRGYMIQLVMSVGMCWGGYMVLVSVLPEAAKGMLPVNKSVFNKAVGQLGSALLNLKDTVLVQIEALSGKQDELGEKQDLTHGEVLEVKTNVKDMRTDLSVMQEALDLCRESLSESERRTSFIARGVQLLTRGVSTILPEHENLLQELMQYNLSGSEFINSPIPKQQQQRLQEAIQTVRGQQQQQQPNAGGNGSSTPYGTPLQRSSSSNVGRSSPPSYSPQTSMATATPMMPNKSTPPEILPVDEDPEQTVPAYAYATPMQFSLHNSTTPVLTLFKDIGYNPRQQYAS